MKKTLIALGLIGLSGSAFAQQHSYDPCYFNDTNGNGTQEVGDGENSKSFQQAMQDCFIPNTAAAAGEGEMDDAARGVVYEVHNLGTYTSGDYGQVPGATQSAENIAFGALDGQGNPLAGGQPTPPSGEELDQDGDGDFDEEDVLFLAGNVNPEETADLVHNVVVQGALGVVGAEQQDWNDDGESDWRDNVAFLDPSADHDNSGAAPAEGDPLEYVARANALFGGDSPIPDEDDLPGGGGGPGGDVYDDVSSTIIPLLGNWVTTCSANVGDIDFGVIDVGVANAPINVETTVEIACSEGTSYTLSNLTGTLTNASVGSGLTDVAIRLLKDDGGDLGATGADDIDGTVDSSGQASHLLTARLSRNADRNQAPRSTGLINGTFTLDLVY